MKLLVIAAALLHLSAAGHVQVKMPYLNSAGVTYVQGHEQQFAAAYVPNPYEGAHYQPQHYAIPQQYEGHYAAYQSHAHLKAPAAFGVATVPVKAAVAVPTVHHVPAVADVPVTKIEAQPAVIQKVVDVAKPAIKTRKFEVRRPAIQKQFYDIEEHIVVRPVGSALVELDEPLSKNQKGPALVQTLENHHQQAAIVAHHEVAAQAAPALHVAAPSHTVAITPVPHGHIVSTVAPTHSYEQASVQHLEQHYAHQEPIAHAPVQHLEQHYAHQEPIVHAPVQHLEQRYGHQEPIAHANHHQYIAQAPIHVTTPHAIVSSTPAPYYEESILAEKNAAAKEAAYAQAHHHNIQHGLESYSNGGPHEHVVVKDAPHVNLKSLNHLSHEEAQDNQQKLIKLLTARGGVAEVGFEKHGRLEPVGDAGISRARVLSATPSPHHEPVEEKLKTRRIVVSRPVQTVQEIDVVEPATKIEQVAIHEPTVIKTAKVGYERVHTSVPVYGKALAPAIAHAQIPVGYYHH